MTGFPEAGGMAISITYQISQECKSRFFYLPFTNCRLAVGLQRLG